MTDLEPPRKKLRKGTRSCLECRRRKIRCTFECGRNDTCDGCFSRGSQCVSQEQELNIKEKRKNVRDRVARLENLCESLSKSVHQLEQRDPALEPIGAVNTTDNDIGKALSLASLDTSMELDLPGPSPVNLREMFNNAVLSSKWESVAMEAPGAFLKQYASQQKYDISRWHLISALPSEADVKMILDASPDWWVMYRELFPQLSVKSKSMLLQGFYRLKLQTTKPAAIATWLLYLSTCIQQLSLDFDRARPDSSNSPSDMVQGYIVLVNRFVVSDDDLVGNLDGIECLILLGKLQFNMGQARKAWMTIRKAITYAQLLGLHHTAEEVDQCAKQQTDDVNLGPPKNLSLLALQQDGIWQTLQTLDSILSLIVNLPPTLQDARSKSRSNSIVGALTKDYLRSLGRIAGRVCKRNQESLSTSLSTTLALDDDLSVLANSQKSEWWTLHSSPSCTIPDLAAILVQYVHCYLSILVHLPFMLVSLSDSRHEYSRAQCLEASRQLLQRYLALRQRMASGFFIFKLVDFQAFSASVCLLLNLLGSSKQANNCSDADREQDQALLREVIQALRLASRAVAGTIAAQAFSVLEALNARLDKSTAAGSGQLRNLTLRIPLLGTITVSPGAAYNCSRECGVERSSPEASASTRTEDLDPGPPEVFGLNPLDVEFQDGFPIPLPSWIFGDANEGGLGQFSEFLGGCGPSRTPVNGADPSQDWSSFFDLG